MKKKENKICGQCKNWSRSQTEVNMGRCILARQTLSEISPINKGIAIRGLYRGQEVLALFGRWFGCRFWKSKNK